MNRHTPQIMGILNVTPDSFSDGGEFNNTAAALQHAVQMLEEGASIIDIGGESTRPGALRQNAKAQIARVANVIRQIKEHIDAHQSSALISIDTTLAQVASAALDSGAQIINDVSAGREDSQMFQLATAREVPIILMHMQGEPANMQKEPHYDNVVDEVKAFLLERAQAAQNAGVAREKIILDPGIGFGKNKAHDTALLNNLDQFVATGYRVMLGASRKRILGELLTAPCEPSQRVGATCATTMLGVQAGINIFRVHDVKENKQALDVAWALKNG